MSHVLLFGFDEQLARWACDRIPWADYQPAMRAVGVADGPGADAQLLAVCTYYNFTPVKMIDGKPWFGTIEIGFAAASPRWASRRTIAHLLRIPFLQYGVRKVATVTPSTNQRAIDFNRGIGMKWEASLRNHFANGVHAQVHSMMRKEFDQRWADGSGKLKSASSADNVAPRPSFHPRKREGAKAMPEGRAQAAL